MSARRCCFFSSDNGLYRHEGRKDCLKLEILLLSVGESQDYAAPGTWIPPAAKEIEDAKTSGPVEEEDEASP
mgnify:CR=1 FL=1